MVIHKASPQAQEFQAGVEAVKEAIIGSALSEEMLKIAGGLGRNTGTTVAGIARAMGPAAFADIWKWARLVLPLQIRLAAEQGLWDLGGEYRRLISGFGPIKGRDARGPVSEREALPAGIERERLRRINLNVSRTRRRHEWEFKG